MISTISGVGARLTPRTATLAASIVIEQNDEWLVGRRYLSNHSLEAILDQETKEDSNREQGRKLTAA